MKKFLFLVITLAIFMTFSNVVMAEESVDVYINGEKLITDQSAIIYQDRTMVPLRAICESLNCEVDWDEDTNTAEISNQITIVALQIGTYSISIKDRRYETADAVKIPIDVAPMLYNDRTMLPVRALSEAVKAKVDWNESRHCVEINTEYDYIADYFYELSVVNKNGKYGYVDKNGKVVIPLIYDFACSSFEDGLALVQLNGKSGFIDKNGIVRIPILFDSAMEFGQGLAPVKQNGKWGYVDRNGDEVFPFIYDKANTFYKDYATAKKNGKYGAIDLNGDVVIPFKYDWVGRIADDQMHCKLSDVSTYYILVDGKWCEVDSE